MSEVLTLAPERPATQPMEMTFYRHGESDANRAQRLDKHKVVAPEIDEVMARHDFQHHLTEKGKQQAKLARAFMIADGKVPEEYFDEWYVSTYVRPIETFAYITNGKVDAIPSALLTERNWGDYGRMTLEKRKEVFAEVERLKEIDAFHTKYPNGDGILDMLVRQKLLLDTFNRELTNARVGVVCHGEQMWGWRYWLEGLTPERWSELDLDKSLRIGNCAIMSYRRDNPEFPDDPDHTVRKVSEGWRRIIDPVEPEKSPYSGEWIKLEGRIKIIGAQALAAAEAYTDRMQDDWLKDVVEAQGIEIDF